MSSDTDQMLEMLTDSADAFLLDRHNISRLRIGEHPSETVVETAIWRQMGELGWLGLTLPEAMGGAGLSIIFGGALCERLGRSLLPEPLIASALIPGVILSACPESDQRDRLAAQLVAGDPALTIAWQEEADRLGVDRIATTLSSNTVTGSKIFVPASLPDTPWLVLCEQAGEAALAVVAADASDMTTQAFRMGDGSRMVQTRFDRTPIADAPIAQGTEARQAVERGLNAGAIALAAQLAGLAEGALALSLDYLKTRTQFGNPIGAFQALQHRAVDLYLLVELAKASWRHAAELYDQHPDDLTTIAAISAAKVAGIKAARKTSEAGVQFFGAMGFTEEADIGLYLRSALHWGSWLGSETAHRRRFYAHTHLEAAE